MPARAMRQLADKKKFVFYGGCFAAAFFLSNEVVFYLFKV